MSLTDDAKTVNTRHNVIFSDISLPCLRLAHYSNFHNIIIVCLPSWFDGLMALYTRCAVFGCAVDYVYYSVSNNVRTTYSFTAFSRHATGRGKSAHLPTGDNGQSGKMPQGKVNSKNQ